MVMLPYRFILGFTNPEYQPLLFSVFFVGDREHDALSISPSSGLVNGVKLVRTTPSSPSLVLDQLTTFAISYKFIM